MKAFRKKIAREGFLAYDVEFHCAEMIGSAQSKSIYSTNCMWKRKFIEEFADNAGLNKTINMVTELFDKTNYGYETIGGSILID